MRVLRFAVPLAVGFALTTGCASGPRPSAGPEQTLKRMPSWYAHDQADTSRLAGKATAVSSDLQTALDIAKSEARADLLLQLEARTTAMTKRFREQTGSAGEPLLLTQFTSVSRDVAAETLRGVRVRQHEVQAEGPLFRAYVLLDLPSGEAARQLLARLRQDERLGTDARAARAFEELSREVQRYEVDRDSAGRPPQP